MWTISNNKPTFISNKAASETDSSTISIGDSTDKGRNKRNKRSKKRERSYKTQN